MIDKTEFSAIMAVAVAAIGKDLTMEQATVYWRLLGDLPAEVLKVAVTRSLLENEYPTIPTIAAIRRLAVESMAGGYLTPSEAWAKVRAVVRVGGGHPEFKTARALLPRLVSEVAGQVGWPFIREGRQESTRTAFIHAYRDAVDVDRETRLLPPHVIDDMKRLRATDVLDDTTSSPSTISVPQQPRALGSTGTGHKALPAGSPSGDD